MKSRITPTLKSRLLVLICVFGLVTQVTFAQANNITVQVDKPGAPVPKTLFGLFFEDINFGADGGLYPERVKNRSFEFPDPLMGWKQINPGDSKGAAYILDQGSVKNVPNSHYLRLKVETPGGGFGVVNEGFRGIGVEKGADYTFSVRARRVEGSPAGLIVLLEDANGRVLGQTKISGLTPDWKKYTSTIRAGETDAKARLSVLA